MGGHSVLTFCGRGGCPYSLCFPPLPPPHREYKEPNRLVILTWRRADTQLSVAPQGHRSGSFITASFARDATGCAFAKGAGAAAGSCPADGTSDPTHSTRPFADLAGGPRRSSMATGEEHQDRDEVELLDGPTTSGRRGSDVDEGVGDAGRPGKGKKRQSVAFTEAPLAIVEAAPPPSPDQPVVTSRQTGGPRSSKVAPSEMVALSPPARGGTPRVGYDGSIDDGEASMSPREGFGDGLASEFAEKCKKGSVASSGQTGHNATYHRAIEHDAQVRPMAGHVFPVLRSARRCVAGVRVCACASDKLEPRVRACRPPSPWSRGRSAPLSSFAGLSCWCLYL